MAGVPRDDLPCCVYDDGLLLAEFAEGLCGDFHGGVRDLPGVVVAWGYGADGAVLDFAKVCHLDHGVSSVGLFDGVVVEGGLNIYIAETCRSFLPVALAKDEDFLVGAA